MARVRPEEGGNIIDAFTLDNGVQVFINDKYIPKNVEQLKKVLDGEGYNHRLFYTDENGNEITDYEFLLKRHEEYVKSRAEHVRKVLNEMQKAV